MKTKYYLFLNAAITFAFVFFVVYLLIAIASFLGCCAGITALFYEHIVWVLLILGIVVFGFCFYSRCYKKNKGG